MHHCFVDTCALMVLFSWELCSSDERWQKSKISFRTVIGYWGEQLSYNQKHFTLSSPECVILIAPADRIYHVTLVSDIRFWSFLSCSTLLWGKCRICVFVCVERRFSTGLSPTLKHILDSGLSWKLLNFLYEQSNLHVTTSCPELMENRLVEWNQWAI